MGQSPAELFPYSHMLDAFAEKVLRGLDRRFLHVIWLTESSIEDPAQLPTMRKAHGTRPGERHFWYCPCCKRSIRIAEHSSNAH